MIYLYLDESGDLGFDFVNKKPSKYFTILIVMVKTITDNKNLSLAVKKTLARKLNPRRSMTKPEILEFNKFIRVQLESKIQSLKLQIRFSHRNSHEIPGLQVADIFTWGVFQKYEHQNRQWYDEFKKKIEFDGDYE